MIRNSSLLVVAILLVCWLGLPALAQEVSPPPAVPVVEPGDAAPVGDDAQDLEAADLEVPPETQPVALTGDAGAFTNFPSSGPLFTGRKGYIHPYISVGVNHTDNLYNEKENEESDTITIISPGVWAALPASREKLLNITTVNTAPGGLEVSRFRIDTKRRFQAYALYDAQFNRLKDNSSQDHQNQRAEGLVRWNLRGGLHFELLDVFKVDHDDYNTGDDGPRTLNRYHSNLFNFLAGYELSPKFRVRGEYSRFSLDYRTGDKGYRDRDDDVFDLYVFYKLFPKLTPFFQYQYTNTKYDQPIQSDYDENNFYGGVQWRITAKSRGRIKLGYGSRSYDEEGRGDQDEFLFEAQLNHRFTPKTSATLKASRNTQASDIEGTDKTSNRFQLGYLQKFTSKLYGRVNLAYVYDEYDNQDTTPGAVSTREDDNYGARFELGYNFRKWLNLSAGYGYRERDSNIDDKDYTRNSLFFFVTAAI